jgi:hypothetical protein
LWWSDLIYLEEGTMLRNFTPRVAALVGLAGLVVAVGVASGSTGASAPPATVSATVLVSSDTGSTFAHRGHLVQSSQLGIRSFVNASDGFALANVGQAQYPANTTNGGNTWRIDGPHFHVNAANAPNVLTRSDVAGQNTYFAYAGPDGGMSVVVSRDAGAHWWRAYLPGVPLAVEPYITNEEIPSGTVPLVAIVEAGPGKFWAYVSRDGGRHWSYDKAEI